MYKIIPSVEYNWWLKRVDTQLNESTNKNLTKVSKVVSQRIRKSCYKTLRTSVINSPKSLNSKDYKHNTINNKKGEYNTKKV